MTDASHARSFTSRLRILGLAALALAGLSACASVPPLGETARYRPAPSVSYGSGPADTAGLTDPRGGRYKLGAPYEANGTWFVPAEEPGYDVQGVAAAYGQGLDGKATANGETFDAAALTAAHPTLPLPSIVEVTNLDNGRVTRVRVNDRGAFASGRVIDLSRGAADSIGLSGRETAKVRVRYVGPARLDVALEPLFVDDQPVRAASPRPAPMPRPAPASGQQVARADGAYAVQAGAFSEMSRAQSVAASLAAAGQADVRPVDVGGRTLYRVVVGGFEDQGAADQARAQVADLGYADARIVHSF